VVLLTPHKNAIIMYKLRFPYELRNIENVPDTTTMENADESQLELAKQLVDSLSTTFDKVDFEDRYQEALMELVQQKVKGKEIVRLEEGGEEAPVVDIMDALKKSIAQAKKKKTA